VVGWVCTCVCVSCYNQNELFENGFFDELQEAILVLCVCVCVWGACVCVCVCVRVGVCV